MSRRILVVEDDEAIRRTIDRGLRVAGHEPTFAPDAASARSRWTTGDFDLVLLDVMLPDGDGIELLAERRVAGDTTPVVLLSAREAGDLRKRALAAGATEYLKKPFAYAELLERVERCTAGSG